MHSGSFLTMGMAFHTFHLDVTTATLMAVVLSVATVTGTMYYVVDVLSVKKHCENVLLMLLHCTPVIDVKHFDHLRSCP